jgi:hypothetical protein
MSRFRTLLAGLLATGLWAGPAGAGLNLANTATRPILIIPEGTSCENAGTIDPSFPGTYPNGTARGSSLSPDFQAPLAGCSTFAANPAADFTDLSIQFFGTLSFLGGTSWGITVPERVWDAAVIAALSGVQGTSFRQTSPLVIQFNTATGIVTPASSGVAPFPVAPNYYTATAGFTGPPALNLTVRGQTSTPSAAFFGTIYQVGNTVPLTLDCAGTFALDNAAGGNFRATFNTYGVDLPPFPLSETGVSFGTGYPWAIPALCATLNNQPGFANAGPAGLTTLTAFVKSLVLLSETLSAVDPVWTPLDWKLEETTDSNANGIPDPLDSAEDPDRDGVPTAGNAGCTSFGFSGNSPAFCCTAPGLGTCVADNCRYTANPDQADTGKLGGAGADGIGNSCQCGDIDNNGQITAADVTQLRRALGGLSPLSSVGGLVYGQTAPGVPVLNKCNVGATTTGTALSECTAADSTVIQRAIGGLSPGIVQGCKAAKATIP